MRESQGTPCHSTVLPLTRSSLDSSVTTILLPAYLSYKALRTNDPAQTHPWLIYFTILSLTLLFESWTLFIIGWIPFYSWFRLIFLLYLVLPQTQGAKVLYLDYLEPYIVHHETQIDQFIGEVHAKLQQMGLGYLNTIIEYARDKILGQKSPQPHEPASTGGGGYASYAQDLLSRFAMPGARTNTPTQPGTTSAGVYSMVSNLAGAAFSGTTSHPRSASAEAASIPRSLFQDIPGTSTAEKSDFISAQRERLSSLLRALDSEQHNLDLAYGSAPTSHRPSSSGTGGLKTKSRSEQSFENVDYDEVARTPGSSTPPRGSEGRRTTSGGWIPAGVTGWFGGSPGNDTDPTERGRDPDSGSRASKGWSAARDITDEISRGVSSGVDPGR